MSDSWLWVGAFVEGQCGSRESEDPDLSPGIDCERSREQGSGTSPQRGQSVGEFSTQFIIEVAQLQAYAMVALGPAFTGFCQQQLLHSQLSLEASEHILRTSSGFTPDQEKTQDNTEEVNKFFYLV